MTRGLEGREGDRTAELPVGTVTFLFTDVEGSTRLVQELGERYPRVLADQRRIIEDAVTAHGGRVFGAEGDALFSAFRDATSALLAAAAAQRALGSHTWPDGRTVRVRMGVHTGEAVLAGTDYVGLTLHQVARITNAAHGGQVVLSDATRAVATGGLSGGVAWRDLGEHRLKDLARPEHLYQLEAPDLPTDFPALRSLDAQPHRLPVQVTSFVGREEIEVTRRLLATTRLLTLTGPGGTGKTRLALQLAAELAADHPDGIYFVPLDAVTDATLVGSAIATALGVDPGGAPPMDRIVAHVGERRMLFVLDNFEQVVDAAQDVARLIRETPHATVVVTSRIVLHISGEQTFPVPPLRIPEAGTRATLQEAAASEAVRLFMERAMAADPAFRLHERNVEAVVDIVTRLDGLPLAIELAAARVRILPVEAVRARLSTRLSLLTGGARDLPARQQTLRGAIDWSYELLDEPERRVFERCAVFAGGACLPEAERVCSAAPGLEGEVLDGLASLTEKSLLRIVPGDGHEPRFAMLPTIAEYALERLETSGDRAAVTRAHTDAYRDLVEARADSFTGADARRALDRVELDHDNIRAAFDRSVVMGDVESAARIGAAMWRFWQIRGHLLEGRDRLDRVLAFPAVADLPSLLRAATFGAAGSIAYWRGDTAAAHSHYGKALEAARASGERAAIARAVYDFGFAAVMAAPAEAYQYQAGRPYFAEALELFRELGDVRGQAGALWALGIAAGSARELVAAHALLLECHALYAQVGDTFGVGWALHMLGLVELTMGRLEDAERRFAEALRLFHATRDMSAIVILLADYTTLASATGDVERTWRLAGACAALRVLTGTDLVLTAISTLSWELPADPGPDDPTALALWEEGRALGVDEAVAYALTGAGEPAQRADAVASA